MAEDLLADIVEGFAGVGERCDGDRIARGRRIGRGDGDRLVEDVLVAVAGPGCVVTFPLVPVLELLSVAVTVWTVPAAMLVVNCTVAIPLALVMLVGALNEPPLVLLQVTVLPEFATGFPKLSASCAVIVTALPAAGVLLLDLTTYFVAGPAVTVKFAEFVPETNCPLQFVF